MGRAEFVALIAMIFATIAFSIDAMLPAMPEIAAELTPDLPHRAPLVLSAFLIGMGIGTFFTGPLSDAFGRKKVIYGGAALYIVAAGLAWYAQSLEMMLIARVFQGLGASGPRVVALAVIRDLYSGRQMAQISSIVMVIFTLVPAVAPALGALIISTAGWRAIFLAFIVFAAIYLIWMAIRLPETLAVERRRPLRARLMLQAVREIFAHRVVRLSILVQSLAMAMLFITLMMVQQIYAEVYDRAASFPYWFGVVAAISATASVLNALLVVRYGMQRLITIAFGLQILLSLVFVYFDLGERMYGFAFFVGWQTYLFFQAGLTLGNLNALAMEPMGHIAGTAASVISAVATVIAALISIPIGTLFDGTAHPLTIAVLVLATLAFGLMMYLGRVVRSAASTSATPAPAP
ncbi:multidrug MFS transporter [Sulfitobacter sp. SK012]|uniref:multidrug effflux MFS transporter n=1 Tax=Sulfitobacter sp. SK012 TaxID=1389005 RepID=UPI000E0B643C|nr:multidrug effflux MFS transporter [Sulfitobacter sp. SK012]AXI46775.1 multidrug MFS transporter [Sulfitobacter sp. SK012]